MFSACETGLGDIFTGEGVLGLQRAFLLAGAGTLVMSLWKVPDEHTKELMVTFYRHLLDGKLRAEALCESQLAMKEKYPDPYYWGASGFGPTATQYFNINDSVCIIVGPKYIMIQKDLLVWK